MSNLLGSLTVEHSGGIHGFLSDLVYLPNEEVCVAILTNCDCEPPSALPPRIAALVIGKPYQPVAISLEAKAFDQYAPTDPSSFSLKNPLPAPRLSVIKTAKKW